MASYERNTLRVIASYNPPNKPLIIFRKVEKLSPNYILLPTSLYRFINHRSVKIAFFDILYYHLPTVRFFKNRFIEA